MYHFAAALRAAVLILAIAAGFCFPPAADAVISASFTFSPPAPLTGDVVTFTSTSTGVTAPPGWDLDGDGSCDDASGTSAQRSFATAGVYPVKMCVTDGSDEATVSRKVGVFNRLPVASFTFVPVAPLAGDQVVLTSISFDPDGPIVGQAWDLDNDGAFDDGTGVTALVALPAPGVYSFGLIVRDRNGALSSARLNLTVAERPPELLASAAVVRVSADIRRRGTRIRELAVSAPDGATVTVRCRGRGCPFRKLTRTARASARVDARSSRTVQIRRLRRRLLRPGAVLQIWVTKPDAIGRYTRFRIRAGKPPSRVDRCVPPGLTRPVRCPTG
jgi:PKD repeat protein